MDQPAQWSNPMWALARAGDAIGVAAIAFFFLVTMMVATAQQDVITRMKAEQLSIGYSSALSLRKDANDNQATIPALRNDAQRTSEAIRSDQTAADEAQRDADLAWGEFEPTAKQIMKLNECDVSLPTDATPRSRAIAANQVQQCSPDSTTGKSATQLLKEGKDEAQQFMSTLQTYIADENKLNSAQSHLAAVQEQLQFRMLTPDQQKVLRSFGDMDVLLQPWMVGGSFFVQFPPALLQILLSFVSGLFGALLITLILIIYPKNTISETVDAHPAKRIVLGGMIALCVYVVLLSGTAVLGSGSSGEGAGTNYMAFAGIGILSGMFSDKVAGWLSKQADTLFKQ
jgi:hypothetical protein